MDSTSGRAESQRFFGLIQSQVYGNMSENRGRRSSCRVCASSAPEVDMLSGMSDVSSSPAAAARTCKCAGVWRLVRTSEFCGKVSLCSGTCCTVSVIAGRSFERVARWRMMDVLQDMSLVM